MKKYVLLALGFAVMTNAEKVGLGNLLSDVRNKFCGDSGVYEISIGNRFGQEVVLLRCITKPDEIRIKRITDQMPGGTHVYFMSPIWNKGDLIPKLRAEIDKIMANEDAWRQGTTAREKLKEIFRETEQAEWDFWVSLPEKEKKKRIQDFIRHLKERDPGAANCGNKFLMPDKPPQ